MRVATWNLERARGAKAEGQCRVLDEIAPDIAVLTEVTAESWTGVGEVVTSPVCRPSRVGGEAWVAIVGKGATPIEPLPAYDSLGVAARFDGSGESIVVYGTVLPWRAAPRQALDLVRAGETADDMFQRVLLAQVRQIAALQQLSPGALVLWIGDFNQTLEGPNYGGSRASRRKLHDALSSLGMTAYNSSSQHARPGMCAIDLICGPASRLRSDRPVGDINPIEEGGPLSDHAGYYVDL